MNMDNIQLIQSKIHEIRGQRVMLDRDLAEMYGVETKVLNQAVKRNIDKGGMFKVTNCDLKNGTRETFEIYATRVYRNGSGHA